MVGQGLFQQPGDQGIAVRCIEYGFQAVVDVSVGVGAGRGRQKTQIVIAEHGDGAVAQGARLPQAAE
jgi:hypothetical protein